MSKPFSLSLFFVSFMPLWISVLFVDIKSIFENQTNLWTEKISIVCILAFTFLSLCVLRRKLHSSGREGTRHYTVIKVKEEKTIATEYLLSYILPLFAFDFTLWNEVILFLIFFLTIGFLCINHNHFSVNIILELLRYRFYICTLKNDDGLEIEHAIISRRDLTGNVNEEIYLKSLNDEYKLDVQ